MRTNKVERSAMRQLPTCPDNVGRGFGRLNRLERRWSLPADRIPVETPYTGGTLDSRQLSPDMRAAVRRYTAAQV